MTAVPPKTIAAGSASQGQPHATTTADSSAQAAAKFEALLGHYRGPGGLVCRIVTTARGGSEDHGLGYTKREIARGDVPLPGTPVASNFAGDGPVRIALYSDMGGSDYAGRSGLIFAPPVPQAPRATPRPLMTSAASAASASAGPSKAPTSKAPTSSLFIGCKDAFASIRKKADILKIKHQPDRAKAARDLAHAFRHLPNPSHTMYFEWPRLVHKLREMEFRRSLGHPDDPLHAHRRAFDVSTRQLALSILGESQLAHLAKLERFEQVRTAVCVGVSDHVASLHVPAGERRDQTVAALTAILTPSVFLRLAASGPDPTGNMPDQTERKAALEAYLQAAGRPNVHTYHHLQRFRPGEVLAFWRWQDFQAFLVAPTVRGVVQVSAWQQSLRPEVGDALTVLYTPEQGFEHLEPRRWQQWTQAVRINQALPQGLRAPLDSSWDLRDPEVLTRLSTPAAICHWLLDRPGATAVQLPGAQIASWCLAQPSRWRLVEEHPRIASAVLSAVFENPPAALSLLARPWAQDRLHRLLTLAVEAMDHAAVASRGTGHPPVPVSPLSLVRTDNPLDEALLQGASQYHRLRQHIADPCLAMLAARQRWPSYCSMLHWCHDVELERDPPNKTVTPTLLRRTAAFLHDNWPHDVRACFDTVASMRRWHLDEAQVPVWRLWARAELGDAMRSLVVALRQMTDSLAYRRLNGDLDGGAEGSLDASLKPRAIEDAFARVLEAHRSSRYLRNLLLSAGYLLSGPLMASAAVVSERVRGWDPVASAWAGSASRVLGD